MLTPFKNSLGTFSYNALLDESILLFFFLFCFLAEPDDSECVESLTYSTKIPLCMKMWAGWMNEEKQHRLEREKVREKGNHLDLSQSK